MTDDSRRRTPPWSGQSGRAREAACDRAGSTQRCHARRIPPVPNPDPKMAGRWRPPSWPVHRQCGGVRGLTLPGPTRRTSGRRTVTELGWLAPTGHPEFCFEPLENLKLHSSLWKTSAPVFLHGAAVAAARPSSRGSILVQSSDSLQVILAKSLKRWARKRWEGACSVMWMRECHADLKSDLS